MVAILAAGFMAIVMTLVVDLLISAIWPPSKDDDNASW